MATPGWPLNDEKPHRQEQSSHDDVQQEKKHAETSVRPVLPDPDALSSPSSEVIWNPGWLSRFPWLGLGTLLTVLVCSAASIIVLVLSDHKSQREWPNKFRPSVILSGLNNVANICFGIAIANGVAIAWWRRTLKGATIEQLHKSWQFSSSVKEAALAGRAFNVIALAALTAKLTIIDGMLMQSATSTYVGSDEPVALTVTGSGSDAIPVTGYIDSAGESLWLNDVLRQNLAVWAENPKQLPLSTFWDCSGLCFFQVPAAGFEYDCTTTQTTIDINSQPGTSFTPNGTYVNTTATDKEQLLYRVKFNSTSWDVNYVSLWAADGIPANQTRTVHNQVSPSNVTMEVIYTVSEPIPDRAACAAVQYNHTCNLTPSVIKYPVLVQNITAGQLDKDGKGNNNSLTGVWVGITEESYKQNRFALPAFNADYKQQTGFEFSHYEVVNESYVGDQNTGFVAQLAPLATAFNTYLGGDLTLKARNAAVDGSSSKYGWDPVHAGNAAMYQTSPVGLESPGGASYECDYRFSDPLYPDTPSSHVQSIVAGINQIMFALSTNVAVAPGVNFTKTQTCTQTCESLDANGVCVGQPQTTCETIPNGNIFDRADPKTWKTYDARAYRESIHYETHYAFLAGAVASTLVCVLFVLPVYWGYWQLGRKVSLGPFEIAHAFRSPMTARAMNGDIEEVIKEVGQQPVQYGHIVAGDARGVLGIAEPEYVARMGGSAR